MVIRCLTYRLTLLKEGVARQESIGMVKLQYCVLQSIDVRMQKDGAGVARVWMKILSQWLTGAWMQSLCHRPCGWARSPGQSHGASHRAQG